MNPASWEILYKVTCHLLCIKHFTHQLVIKMNKIISHFLHFWVVFLRICLTSFDKNCMWVVFINYILNFASTLVAQQLFILVSNSFIMVRGIYWWWFLILKLLKKKKKKEIEPWNIIDFFNLIWSFYFSFLFIN